MLDEIEKKIESSVELGKRGRPQKILGLELTWEKVSVMLTQKNLIDILAKRLKLSMKILAHGRC